MRLTLRTLLSYLDDTLPPSEAKQMGAKLAESEPAQEIVERITNVIRRRRLTVPAASSRIDPNTVAEYLDNEITPELAEELERICLSSDVHLAEVAACHQILSLVLGEAPAAPEGAAKRMYALSKGGVVGRKRAGKGAPAVAASGKTPPAERDADETLRMGLPAFLGPSGASRGIIGIVAGVACLLLVAAVAQLLKSPTLPDDVVPAPIPAPEPIVVAKAKTADGLELIKVLPKPSPTEVVKVEPPMPEPKPTAPPEPKPTPSTEPAGLPPPTFSTIPDAKLDTIFADVGSRKPSTNLVSVGQLLEPAKGQAAIVLQAIGKLSDWKRLTGKEVFSTRVLASLPGSRAVLATPEGARLTLWGNFPEQIPSPPVAESSVVLYEHESLDLDLTHRRGRLLIANVHDEPLRVRIRFENPAEAGGETSWLLTLSKDAEALIDRWSMMPLGEPFYKFKDDPARQGPVAHIACMALSGSVSLKTPTESFALQPAPSVNLAVWSSNGKKMQTLTQQPLPWMDARSATPPEFAKVRAEVDAAFAGKAVDVALAELLRSNDPLTRRTAVRSLGAMDDLSGLVDLLHSDKPDVRDAAVETLRVWIAHSRDNDYKLHDLVSQRYNPTETELFMNLLHGFSQQAVSQPETYEILIERLRHKQLPIRELAAWNLYRMAPAGKSIPYDANDATVREKAYQSWLKLVPAGKLPPAPPKTKAAVATPAGARVDHAPGTWPVVMATHRVVDRSNWVSRIRA